MGYCAASDVASLADNLLGGFEVFDTSSSPSVNQVNAWISTGCAVIETRLSAEGYSMPVASTATAFNFLRDCNALFAISRAELGRTAATIEPGQRTRGQVFDEMFRKCLDDVLSMDLTQAGVSRSSNALLYVGGISRSDKQTREADTDRVPPRFSRGMFDDPETITPVTSTAS